MMKKMNERGFGTSRERHGRYRGLGIWRYSWLCSVRLRMGLLVVRPLRPLLFLCSPQGFKIQQTIALFLKSPTIY